MEVGYVVVRYRQLVPTGFAPGEDVKYFGKDYAEAQSYAEGRQKTHPAYWWHVESRSYSHGPQG